MCINKLLQEQGTQLECFREEGGSIRKEEAAELTKEERTSGMHVREEICV
jgi:hypothetical protein